MTPARWLVIGVLAVVTVTVVLLDATGVIFPPTPEPVPPPPLTFATPAAPPSPLAAVDASTSAQLPEPVLAAVREALSDDALGSSVSATITTTDGQTLLEDQASQARSPASSLKLLTALSVLQELPADTTLQTSIVAGSKPHSFVLVGGGDATLTVQPSPDRDADVASLAELARKTANALRKSGEKAIHLSYDTSLFTGPSISPHWEPTYVTSGVIAPVTALMANQGLVTTSSLARYSNPAQGAALQFATLLRDNDINVKGDVDELNDSDAIAPVAQVESPTLATMVQRMLRDSDNQVAESLSRVAAAAAGQPASFDGGVTAMVDAAGQHGISVDPQTVFDGSGLSRDDAVTVQALALVLGLAANDQQFRPILGGLPIAGFDGTLADRYVSAPQSEAAGVVRAKTGTLTGISTESGATVSCDGALVLFSFAADRVRDTVAARDALDRGAAALATCQ